MKKKNVLGIIAGILFFILAVGSAIGVVQNAMDFGGSWDSFGDWFDFIFKMADSERLENIPSGLDEEDILYPYILSGYSAVNYLAAFFTSMMSIVIFLLFGIGNLQSKTNLIKAGAGVSIGEVVYSFATSLLAIWVLLYGVLVGIVPLYYIGTEAAKKVIIFIICLLMNIFLLNLAKKSARPDVPLKGDMIAALVMIGIFALYYLVTDSVGFMNSLHDTDSFVQNSGAVLFNGLSGCIQTAAMVLMCIRLGNRSSNSCETIVK